jgi:hypothetical protein
VRKREGKNRLVRTMHRGEDNIKIFLKGIWWPGWINLVQNMDIRRAVVNVAMNCWSFIKFLQFLNYLRNYCILTKSSSVPRELFANVRSPLQVVLPLNAGIKSLRAALPDEVFTGDFASWTVHFFNICVKTPDGKMNSTPYITILTSWKV